MDNEIMFQCQMKVDKVISVGTMIRKMNDESDSYDKEVAVTLLPDGSANFVKLDRITSSRIHVLCCTMTIRINESIGNFKKDYISSITQQRDA